MKKPMIFLFLTLLLLAVAVVIFLQQEKFGALPSGDRLQRIQSSSNSNGDIFQNLEKTPELADGHSMISILQDRLFPKEEKQNPKVLLPSVTTNLKELEKNEDLVVWFGHSSFYLQIQGKRILVDPVLSGSASPFSFMIRSFDGSDVYTAEQMPQIDYLFITHDHWDHLDHKTILNLKDKVKLFVCPLGVGSHLEEWGVPVSLILEGDWWETFEFESGFSITFTPSRHFSGRGLTRNKTLWTSYVLKAKGKKYFLSGDGGYGKHIQEIAQRYAPIDFAVLENGQYNDAWKYIHMLPTEVMKTAKELDVQLFLPIHSAKFDLANHHWFEPLDSIYNMNQVEGRNMATPLIGEKVPLNTPHQATKAWWRELL